MLFVGKGHLFGFQVVCALQLQGSDGAGGGHYLAIAANQRLDTLTL